MRSRMLKIAVVLLSFGVTSTAFAQAGGGEGGGGGGGTGGDASIMQLRNSDHQQRALGAEFQRRALQIGCQAICPPIQYEEHCRQGRSCATPPSVQNAESCNSGSIRRTVVSGIPRYSCEGRRRNRG